MDERIMKKVKNLKEFIEARNCGEKDFSEVERATYKYTNCGAWITQDEEGILVGSIVEGCDHGTEVHGVNYPFEIDDFWKVLELVEKEAEEIWNDTHGCGEENIETGSTAINPDCKTCEGEGAWL